MTVSEFKAWFEGYTEQITKAPTQKQWARICERVAEVHVDAGTCHHFHYRESYPCRQWYPTWYTTSGATNPGTVTATYASQLGSAAASNTVRAELSAANSVMRAGSEFELSNSTAWALARDVGVQEGLRDSA